jgi:hypothetical protein
MAYEEKEGFGGLFKNSYKEKESQPDYKGTIMIDGKVLKLAGWNKEYGTEGKTRISLAVDTFEPKKQDGFAQAKKVVDGSREHEGQDSPLQIDTDAPF